MNNVFYHHHHHQPEARRVCSLVNPKILNCFYPRQNQPFTVVTPFFFKSFALIKTKYQLPVKRFPPLPFGGLFLALWRNRRWKWIFFRLPAIVFSLCAQRCQQEESPERQRVALVFQSTLVLDATGPLIGQRRKQVSASAEQFVFEVSSHTHHWTIES